MAVCVALLCALSGCFASDAPPAEIEDDEATDLLEGARARNYRAWENPPTSADLPPRRVAQGPHGPFVEIYLDPELLVAFFEEREEPVEAWPVGVAAVAETYVDDVTVEPALYQVMLKTEGGWIWAQLDDRERSIGASSPDDCVGCHGAADDFVFSLFLP